MRKTIIVLIVVWTLASCENFWRNVEMGTGFILDTGAAQTTNGVPTPINSSAPFNYPVVGGGAAIAIALELLRRFARAKRIEKENHKEK